MESLNQESFTPEKWASSTASLEEWNEAYRRVEAYFSALRVSNKLLLSSLVLKILDLAHRRHQSQPERRPLELAAEETDRMLVSWFRKVLGVEGVEVTDRLSAQGRLTLLLMSEEVPWQELFLTDQPIPGENVEAFKNAYLVANPDFSFVRMQPRPIDLGVVDVANRAFDQMGAWGNVVQWALWLGFATILALTFFSTR
ncbi:MAG: hypothetical protein P1U68_04220 [Verrucomicrobiales bacterium]|nr:hypothetical protein [Verrucomicrobiales bacterium]